MTKSLTDIVKAQDVVQNTEYLQTLMVVVPKWASALNGINYDLLIVL